MAEYRIPVKNQYGASRAYFLFTETTTVMVLPQSKSLRVSTLPLLSVPIPAEQSCLRFEIFLNGHRF